MQSDRRRTLKAVLGCGAALAGGAFARRCARPPLGSADAPIQSARAAAAHRVLAHAEDSWGLIATRDQWKAPVTSGWTWIAYDQWQAPRREPAIIGTGAFLRGGAAVTVSAGGRIWQDVEIPAAGSYRLFLRIADFGDGVNCVAIECGGVVHASEWGTSWRWLNTATLRRRLRGAHSLLSWREVGTFPLTAGTQRVTIDAQRAEQSYLIVDALYFTDDATEQPPRGWNPLATPSTRPGPPVKRRRTIVSDDEIETGRANVRQFRWARDEADRIVRTAREYADRSDEEIWRLMPSSRIPRAESVAERGVGCPVHGRRVEQSDVPWKIDPFHHPYQLQCSVGGEWYPARVDASNDEQLRRAAQREAGAGRRRFIRHYCHEVYLRHVRPAAIALGRAYALTGDRAYARTAAVLLCRVALEYPDGADKRDRAFRPPYSFGSGAIVNTIWSGEDLSAFAACYDFIADAIQHDEPLVRFLRGKSASLDTEAAVRSLIEEGLLRTMAQGAIDGAIHANPGTYESGLAAVALCLDDVDSGRYPDSHEMIRSVYYDQNAQESSWSIPKRYLTNLVHPNGCPDSSVDYGSLLLSLTDFGARVETLRRLHPDRFDDRRYPNILLHPRLRRHIDFLTDVVCLNRYHPALGDGHGKALWNGDNLVPVHTPPRMSTLAYPQAIDTLFRAHPDRELAALLLEGTASDAAHHPLFARSIASDVEALADHTRIVPARTSLLDDHGVVMLRGGGGDAERVLCVNYRGGPGDHRHADRFAIGLFGHGLDLLPELPYLASFDFKHLNAFERHPLLHNTVTFDRRAEAGGPAYLARLVETEGISVATARSSAPSGGERSLERTCVLVNVDAERWYVLDVTHASGGTEHHLSLHTAIARDITVRGVALHRQPGTMASPSGRYGDPTNIPGALEGLHPFCFMTGVESGTLNDPYSVVYRFGDARDVHLRVWGVAPPGTTLSFADARPPLDPDAYTVRYLLAHRHGSAPLVSAFATVMEPYRGSGFIDRIEPLVVESPAADIVCLRVVMADRTDTVLVNPTGARVRSPDGTATDARFVLFSERSGRVDQLLVSSGTEFRRPDLPATLIPRPLWSGQIAAVDRVLDGIVVNRSDIPARDLEGMPIRLHNDFFSRMYRIVSSASRGERTLLRLERSSLLAEGVAQGFHDGVVLNKVLMPFAVPGCTLESHTGTSPMRIVGRDHVGHAGTDLLVRTPGGVRPDVAALEREFRGSREFSVHAYGPGDRFEIATHHYFDRRQAVRAPVATQRS